MRLLSIETHGSGLHFFSRDALTRLVHLNPCRHRGWGDATPSVFPEITRERIGRSSRNLFYLTFERFYMFSENFKTVPTMTCDMISKIMLDEICVLYRFNA